MYKLFHYNNLKDICIYILWNKDISHGSGKQQIYNIDKIV